MSNHSGSYLLNETLTLLDQFEVFESMGQEKMHQFFEEIGKISRDWDCNSSEILEGIGEKLGICYGCFGYDENLDESGLCSDCNEN